MHIGSVRMTPYRLVLLAVTIPVLIRLFSGRDGRFLLPDLLIGLAFAWAALACFTTPGTRSPLEAAGVLLLEGLGAYLLARVIIRSPEDFRRMIGFMLGALAILLPFALVEAWTGTSPLLLLADGIADSFPQIYQDPRMGIHRVQSIFEHSITYSVFCASIFACSWYLFVKGGRGPGRFAWFSVIPVSTFLSVSGGGYAILLVQAILMGWERVTRRIAYRWRLFGLLAASGFGLLALYAAKSPFHILVFRLSFSSRSGYGRILIWDHGTDEVLRQPFFGLGLEIDSWSRPFWMGPSIDNFWLLLTMSYGVPMVLLLACAILAIMWHVGSCSRLDARSHAVRAGYLMALVGLIVAGMTVHYWNAMFVWFMFFLGSGVFLIDPSRVPQRPRPHRAEVRKALPRPASAG
jgi:hypothetical protein